VSWEPSVDVGVWGRLQILIDDTDVTFFRGVPTQIQSWSSGDPFDDATAVLAFPQISPFETLGVGELSWLHGHAQVDIRLVRPDNSTKVLWEGMIASIEDDTSESTASTSVQCIGALYQLDYYVRAPKNLSEKKERLYEHAIRDEFHPPNKDREALKTKRLRIVYPDGMTDTDWKTRYSGAWEKTLTGYIQRLLADMVHNPGLIKEPGTPEIPGIPGKNETQDIVLAPESPPFPWGNSYPSTGPENIKGYYWFEFRGTRTAKLFYNQTSASQVRSALIGHPDIDDVTVTGSGTKASPWRVVFTGARVRERPQPLIKLVHYDLRHDHSATRVTRVVGGEKGIAGTPAVPPSAPEPWDGAWTLLKNVGRVPVLKLRDEANVSWTVSAGAPGVEHSLKSDFSQTPNVIYGEGTDESATTWRNSEVIVGRDGETTTKHYPLAWDESTYPANKRTSESGEVTDPPPNAYSVENIRVEIMQKYGAGVSLLDAKRSGDQQLLRELEPGYFGTVTLKSDPEEGSRFEIKAGTNLRLKHYRNLNPPQREIFAELKRLGIFTEPHYTTPLTRGKFATLLIRLMAEISQPVPTTAQTGFFPDVPSGHEHASSINRLAAIGVAQGYPSGLFGPGDNLRRDEMAGFVARLAEWGSGTTLTASYNHFNDRLDTGSLRRSVNAAIENHLVTMYPNNAYYPATHATRLEAAETLYLLNRFLGGDILADAIGLFVHIAQVEANVESGTVTLTVDSKARDLATLAQLIERTKSENQNPAKMLMVNRESGKTDDTKFPWDYDAGSGSIPKAARTPRHGALPKGRPDINPTWFVYVNGANSDPWKRWTIVPVVAAGKGSVSRSEIRAYDRLGRPLAIPFHAGVYSMYITEYSMPQQPFQPDAFRQPADTGDALSGYDPSAIVLWGQQGQRAGYWPGLESEGNPVTGIMIDEGTWQFQLPEGENVLWVALYAEVNAYFQGRFYHGVQ
jgi:hypothetical protein